jgi:prepilin-type N-terminal cleavage/methylation domain-containing protein
MNKKVTETLKTLWKFCVRRKLQWCGRRTPVPQFVLYACIVLYGCLFFAIPQQATASVIASASAPAIHQTSAGIGTTTAAPAKIKPAFTLCELLVALVVICVIGVIIGKLLYLLCHTLHWGPCGPPPPQSPTNNTDNAQSPFAVTPADSTQLPNINPNVALPATVFYLSNDEIVSNSAGLPNATLSLLGNGIISGATIYPSEPGEFGVGLWEETNSYADGNLDPNNPYTAVVNFTVLTCTNLSTPWREFYTVEGWCNADLQHPLACMVYYTNGVPMTTNWIQAFGPNFSSLTNVVVYGALPQFPMASTVTNPPAIVPADGIIPPGTGTNSYPFASSSQFFTLCCCSNYIATSWPYTNPPAQTAQLKTP